MGLLQIDFVNIVTPSHYLVLYSRLGSYDKSALDRVVYTDRQFLEHWAHEASIVPVDLWPALAYRRETHRVRPWGFEEHFTPAYLRRVKREVEKRGPLRADELAPPKGSPERLSETWYRTIQRIALEALFGSGDLAIASREPDFARRYDLSHRIVPEVHRARRMTHAEQHRELLTVAARASGVATAADLADYFRMPASLVKPRIPELVEQGILEPVRIEGWKETAYLAASNHPAGKPSEELRILSPFDPLVWFRKRTQRLFDFEYRLEIFVPEAKRRWGCFCLPILLGDQLVARVDAKAERKEGVLAVLSIHIEPQAQASDALFELLPQELHALARWLGLERAAIPTRLLLRPRRGSALRGRRVSSPSSRASGPARP